MNRKPTCHKTTSNLKTSARRTELSEQWVGGLRQSPCQAAARMFWCLTNWCLTVSPHVCFLYGFHLSYPRSGEKVQINILFGTAS